jgi:hypothetical protein
MLTAIQEVKRRGKKLVWMSDDDLWNIPRWNPCAEGVDEEALDALRVVLAEEVRVLWAGSLTHSKDLDEVAPAVERLAEEYGEQVRFLLVRP